MNPQSLAAVSLAALSAGILSWLLTDKFLLGVKWKQARPLGFNRLSMMDSKPFLLLVALVFPVLCFDYFLGLLLAGFLLAGLVLFKRGPSWIKRYAERKKCSGLREVFPQSLGMVIQCLRTGQTVPQILEYLSREGVPPLRGEWMAVCAEMNLGASAEQALSKMNERVPDFREFGQFLESYKISRQTGANLTQLLEVLLEGLEEKNRILRKMEALTAQARLSGLMVGLLPFLLAIVFFVMDPGLLTPLVTQKSGWAILTLAFFLETIGFVWIRQLLRLEV